METIVASNFFHAVPALYIIPVIVEYTIQDAALLFLCDSQRVEFIFDKRMHKSFFVSSAVKYDT